MRTIVARNVNEALMIGIITLRENGVEVAPWGIKTLEYPTPVATTYLRPTERVLFETERDANPFFHLMEALWILAGREDVSWLSWFNGRIATFSDDGDTFHAPYGYRLRHAHGFDQIKEAIYLLQRDPDTRRCAMTIWKADDLITVSKDIPCNDMIFLKLRDGKLNMTVANRSNDMLWGAYGANAVQFSMLQEYIAAHLGVEVGKYNQVSDSFHVYTDDNHAGSKVWNRLSHRNWLPDWYADGLVEPFPLVDNIDRWDAELYDFIAFNNRDCSIRTYGEPFFMDVAQPVSLAWYLHKNKKEHEAMTAASKIAASDWRRACLEWLERRYGCDEPR